jgi:hypothetical protein
MRILVVRIRGSGSLSKRRTRNSAWHLPVPNFLNIVVFDFLFGALGEAYNPPWFANSASQTFFVIFLFYL